MAHFVTTADPFHRNVTPGAREEFPGGKFSDSSTWCDAGVDGVVRITDVTANWIQRPPREGWALRTTNIDRSKAGVDGQGADVMRTHNRVGSTTRSVDRGHAFGCPESIVWRVACSPWTANAQPRQEEIPTSSPCGDVGGRTCRKWPCIGVWMWKRY